MRHLPLKSNAGASVAPCAEGGREGRVQSAMNAGQPGRETPHRWAWGWLPMDCIVNDCYAHARSPAIRHKQQLTAIVVDEGRTTLKVWMWQRRKCYKFILYILLIVRHNSIVAPSWPPDRGGRQLWLRELQATLEVGKIHRSSFLLLVFLQEVYTLT